MADSSDDKTQISRPKIEDYGSLQPGSLIGRYEIVSVLGQGGFGITYRARDTQLDRDVAIKEYLPSSLAVRTDGTTVLPRSTQMADDFVWGRARFLDEAKTMARFANAPAIVRVHDFLEANGTAYVVMPLLEGETLDARLKRDTRLQQPAIERILYPLLDGLEQVHAAGFLHRDIKPANIILDASGAPTLIDFGASRAALQGRSQSHTAVFTPGFAPLEQMVSGQQGPWTDIYALAATLYACVNGKPPPPAMERMISGPITAAAEIGKRRYAPSLLAAIDAGLRLKAENRPQSIDAWRDVLATGAVAAVAETPVAFSETVMQTTTPPLAPAPIAPAPAVASVETPVVALPQTTSSKSRMPLFAGIAAVVLLLAAGGGWFAFAPGSKPATGGAALQDLKVEDLERVLAERRKADAAAAEKKRLEEEAQRKAEADTVARKAADTELADAQLKRRKAEEELAKLKAEMEARRQAEAGQQAQADAAARRAAEEAAQRKAEAEMAALRQSEVDAQKKADAEAAAQKQAEEALAKAQAARAVADAEAKQRAEAEAKQKSEANANQLAEAQAREKAAAEAKAKVDADAKVKADAEVAAAAEKKAAEAAETALRLTLLDRRHIQVALTALGFDTRGSDGTFGPRSREMIANWQKARSQPATGYLNGSQNQTLLQDAAPAVTRFDADQKKIEEDKIKADEEAKAKLAAAVAPAPGPAAASTLTTPKPAPPALPPAAGGGSWGGQAKCQFWSEAIPVRIVVADGKGSATAESPNKKGRATVTLAGSQVSGSIWSQSADGRGWNGNFSGSAANGKFALTTILRADQKGAGNDMFCTIELTRTGG